jgi:membrane associated rhomboid family serine protease
VPKDARGTDDRVSFRRFPLTFTLVGLNVGMLLVAGIRSGHLGGIFDPDPSVLCRLGAVNTQATLGQPSQWWRLLTAIVLHVNLLHLLVNSYALLFFAPGLEEPLGPWRFLAVYVGGGAAGAAASLAVYHPQLGLGASGAIFGVGGGLVALWYHYRASIGRDVWGWAWRSYSAASSSRRCTSGSTTPRTSADSWLGWAPVACWSAGHRC